MLLVLLAVLAVLVLLAVLARQRSGQRVDWRIASTRPVGPVQRAR
jgi:hypothetical protein